MIGKDAVLKIVWSGFKVSKASDKSEPCPAFPPG